MKKFLKDISDGPQVVEEEVFKKLFPLFDVFGVDSKKNNSWKVVAHGKLFDFGEWQVAVQTFIAAENDTYYLFIFDANGDLEANLSIKAVHTLPPVSEKTEGLDYYDWMEIQGTLFKWLADRRRKVFLIDMSPKGKFVYKIAEPEEECFKKIKSGEKYEIAVIKAEVFVEKVKQWKLEQQSSTKDSAPTTN